MLDCPICQQMNACTADERCWCMTAAISQEALRQLPEEATACICQTCAEKYAIQKTV